MDSNKEQFLEKDLERCKKMNCNAECCHNISPVREWIVEYFTFHDKIRDKLISSGVKINFKEDKVFFENCSPGKRECSFLKHSPENVDLRPLECKIYPYRMDWHNVDFDKKSVILFCVDGNCPLVRENKKDEEYRREIEKIIKRDFAKLFNGVEFEVQFFKDGEFE